MGKIIGFYGPPGSGKNTACDILIKNFPEYNFIHISFAEKLKDCISLLFNIDRQLLEGIGTQEFRNLREIPNEKIINLNLINPETNIKAVSIRDLLRSVANAFKTMSPDIWINLLKQNIDLNKNYVISDVRFKNEIDFIQSHNGEVFYINSVDDESIKNYTSLKDFEKQIIDIFERKIKKNDINFII